MPKSHMVNNPKESRQKGRDISIEVDQIDHEEIWLLLKRYQQISEQKEYLL
jgi:hypothetical protein